jgi:hypothetical protein
MSKSIDELNGKTVKTQERWLRLQNQLVAWQQKFEDIDAEVLLLGKTIMISEKTKIRTEKVIAVLDVMILCIPRIQQTMYNVHAAILRI